MPKPPASGKAPSKAPPDWYAQQIAQQQQQQAGYANQFSDRFNSVPTAEHYAHQQAFMDSLNAFQQAQSMPKPSPPPIPLMRTKEEITAQLEARYDELVKQSEKRRTTCDNCKWHRNSRQCGQPLIQGYDPTPAWNYESAPYGLAKLCGREKALWEEKIVLTWWQRILMWFQQTGDDI